MTNEELAGHVLAVMELFQNRGVDENVACAVMGSVLGHIIRGDLARQTFLTTLQLHWSMMDDKSEMRSIN